MEPTNTYQEYNYWKPIARIANNMVQVDYKREIKSRSLENLREKWKIKVIMDIKSLTTFISPNNMKFWLEFKR
jgi:hypothetical protein